MTLIREVGQEVVCPECGCRAEVTKRVFSIGTSGYWATLSCSCGADWGDEIWCGDGMDGVWIALTLIIVLVTLMIVVVVR